jgi:hypothetical protein
MHLPVNKSNLTVNVVLCDNKVSEAASSVTTMQNDIIMLKYDRARRRKL